MNHNYEKPTDCKCDFCLLPKMPVISPGYMTEPKDASGFADDFEVVIIR